MAMLKLTEANYYGREANEQYMSASQYKSFVSCEKAALAELRGEWSRPASNALMVGSYVDAYFSGELEQFRAENPEIFKRDGTLKAEFQQAQTVAERLEKDELARMLLSGQHQTIKTGKIGGVWYKAKFDSLLEPDRVEEICKKFPDVRQLVPFGGAMIVDLKYMRNFEPVWNEEAQQYLHFYQQWGYDIQGAIYQALDGRLAPFAIVGVTKETEPDIAAIHIPDEDLAFCLADVKEKSPRFAAIKRGEIEPVGCGQCAYCKSVKRLHGISRWN